MSQSCMTMSIFLKEQVCVWPWPQHRTCSVGVIGVVMQFPNGDRRRRAALRGACRRRVCVQSFLPVLFSCYSVPGWPGVGVGGLSVYHAIGCFHLAGLAAVGAAAPSVAQPSHVGSFFPLHPLSLKLETWFAPGESLRSARVAPERTLQIGCQLGGGLEAGFSFILSPV